MSEGNGKVRYKPVSANVLEFRALLVPESPLMVLPGLALVVGLNEAIILQQLHYWLRKSAHVQDGRPWVYNTYGQWTEQFPFWSVLTVKRAIKSLEERGIVLSGNYNKHPMDRTKWYTIDYDRLVEVARSGRESRGELESPHVASDEERSHYELISLSLKPGVEASKSLEESVCRIGPHVASDREG